MSFLAAIIYYSQHDWLRQRGLIPPPIDFISGQDAQVVIGSVFVVWAVFAEIWSPVDPFAPFEFVCRAIFLRYPEEEEDEEEKKKFKKMKGKEGLGKVSIGETKYLTKTSAGMKKKKRM